MSAADPNRDDPGETLDELLGAKQDAIERCYYRTASRLASEIKRTAKASRRLHPYVWALHSLTNHAGDLLDPEQGREAAIELIAVLESEERARQVQPDVDPGEYEWLVSQVSSCAYDNLGEATALARGYNSEGLHDAIAEGIQVCRRTGKLECILCFRGYADEVFLAADDLEMALHHARHVVAHGNVRPGFDRRWSGADDETKILIIAGQLDAAEAAVRRASELVGSYHSPLRARLATANYQETLRLLRGEADPAAGPGDGPRGADDDAPPGDEFPTYHLQTDMVCALRSCLRGDHAAAITVLTTWDRRLAERQCLRHWFEVRLRLIAAYRLAGDDRRVSTLAQQLEPKAREARDWITLRRLSRLLDPAAPVSPIAPAGPLVAGAGAPASAGTVPDGPGPSVAGGDGAGHPAEAREPTPLSEALGALASRMAQGQASDDPDVRNSVLDSLLGIGPDVATHPGDVALMLHLARLLGDDPARSPSIWDWAESIAAPFPRVAAVLNLLAALGDTLRSLPDSPVAGRIDAQRIESLFRQSLDLDPDSPGNFGRAAIHHAGEGRMNEAERCLARVLRLDRSNIRAALWLAEIYRDSDRAHDALAVLDMALRAGCDSPEVAWQAVVLAHSLGQFEESLIYIDQFERTLPGNPWAQYYRASSLLRLGRAAEALAALDEEERRTRPGSLHVSILRACAASDLGRLEDLRAHLAAVLEVRLAEVDDLTHSGLIGLFGRLWVAAVALPEDDPLRAALEGRLLATGLAPNGLFEGHRRAAPKADGLSIYVCTLLQPLDIHWRDSPGCLAGEGDWTGYRISWGILAPDEAEAGRIALDWQARCYSRQAEIEQVGLQEEGYSDHPGAIWQGIRGPQEST